MEIQFKSVLNMHWVLLNQLLFHSPIYIAGIKKIRNITGISEGNNLTHNMKEKPFGKKSIF